ncbi:hypothetical protein ACTGU6_07730 [Streptococcus suis]
MKIKLLYQDTVLLDGTYRTERIDEFEDRINEFIAGKKVINIQYQESNDKPSVMVMYNETN